MLFNSVTFILYFLPAALLVYYMVPNKFKNAVLLLESFVFYAFSDMRYLPLAVSLVMINYLFARAMGPRASGSKSRRALLIAALIIDILLLAAFKYGSCLSGLLNRIMRGDVTFLDVLPLGISYYLFKLISYLCDVYTGKCEPEENIIDFSVYVLMYQQILVGPIIRYTDIRDALKDKDRHVTPEEVRQGTRLFVYGLAKKVILADTMGMLWSQLAGADGIGIAKASSALVWLAVLAYSLQLYLDFSGYSEMSNGLSCMMGFSCKQNFAYPYLSCSVTQFWRRWHITLSEWFRDYVYIPLGGNRKGTWRHILNMLIVWVLTGIWHGRTVNFLIWGVYYFVILLLEKYVLKALLDKQRFAGHIYTLFVAVTGWGIFAADGVQIAVWPLLKKMFVFSSGVSVLYFIRCYGVALILSVAVSGGFYKKVQKKMEDKRWLETLCLGFIFVLSLAYVVGSTGQAALYAGF